MRTEISGAFLVLGILSVLLQALCAARAKTALDGEKSRKLLHISTGLIALSFPWIFHSATTVIVLSIICASLLAFLKYFPSNKLPWKSAVCSVNRESFGEILFPLAIGALFAFANGDPILYCIPLAILTLADACSALIGIRYGTKRYHTVDGCKTAEGSLVFFVVAFLTTHIPLLLYTNLGRAESLLISLIIGLLAMLLEGTAWRGLDNMFIPMGTYLALHLHLRSDVKELIFRLILLVVLTTALMIAKQKTTLNGSAILGVTLYSYYAFITGGIVWMMMPLIVLTSYTRILPARFRNLRSVHSMYAVTSVASTGILWLVCAINTDASYFIFPYALAFAIHETIIAIGHMPYRHMTKFRLILIANATFKSWALVFVPWLLLGSHTKSSILDSLIAPAVIFISALVFYATRTEQAQMFACRHVDCLRRWVQQAAIVAAGSAVGLLPCFHLIPLGG